ncbi:unnamed protein product [Lactuca saligna]|uniref:Uncharacterized protein n=1 Tax=Lactuca saligna TaxID=75948 RepID=A0AA36E572_LACSI|nr:unnamed protein product [Lactuca saligna]
MLVLNSVIVVMVVTRMTETLMMKVTTDLVGIKTTTVVIGVIKATGVEMGTTTIIGTARISPMVATMTTTMDSEIKALGINIEGIQMVDSTMQMVDTTMQMVDTTTKVTNSLIFIFRSLIDMKRLSHEAHNTMV